MMDGYVEIFRELQPPHPTPHKPAWRWHLKAGNNEILATSEGYTRQRDAVRGWLDLRTAIAGEDGEAGNAPRIYLLDPESGERVREVTVADVDPDDAPERLWPADTALHEVDAGTIDVTLTKRPLDSGNE